jgi:hypothetical protein
MIAGRLTIDCSSRERGLAKLLRLRDPADLKNQLIDLVRGEFLAAHVH